MDSKKYDADNGSREALRPQSGTVPPGGYLAGVIAILMMALVSFAIGALIMWIALT